MFYVDFIKYPTGSGKTTLLAILTGDHPQSFTQDHLLLPSLQSLSSSKPVILPRSRVPTAHLRRVIGVSSPEMFDAFPRRHPGMSVWEAVGTGFDGGFVPRTKDTDSETRKMSGVGWVDVSDEELDFGRHRTKDDLRAWRIQRCWEVLECLGPASWKPEVALGPNHSAITHEFASTAFSELSPGEQRMVLLMRALVNRPPLVLLDEAWSGMDENMIRATRKYLRGELKFGGQEVQGVDGTQAVVLITHWEAESPWEGDELKRFKLSDRP